MVQTHNAVRSNVAGMLVAAVAAVGATNSSANAVPSLLQYTMTLNGVSGSYAGSGFTNQTLTLTFVYDGANVRAWPNVSGSYQATFANGRGANNEAIRVTLGSILTNAALDDVAANNTGLLAATGNAIYLGKMNGSGDYATDMATLTTFASGPGAGSSWDPQLAFTTVWSSTASGLNTFSGGSRILVIGGQNLTLSSAFGSAAGGSWGVANYTPSAVPGAGLAGLATLGFAGMARRRRR